MMISFRPRPAGRRDWFKAAGLVLSGQALLLSALCLGCGADAQAENGTEEGLVAGAQSVGEWVTLFDGETFDGWIGLGRDSVPGGHWAIEDGTIRKVASGTVPTAPDGQPLVGGDLRTIKTYRDFELVFEWKVAPGANSGIKYNVSEEMSVASPPFNAALGFEYQILDDDLHPDAQNGPNRTAGALYDLVSPDPAKPLQPVGSFNEGRIVFANGHGEHWLNGTKVLEFDLGTPEFEAFFAASKYAPVEGFAHQRSGHIVLQDHGDDVWFRNIKIREITP